jgi:hypothetical protein
VDIWHCNARGAYSGWSRIDPDKEVDVEAIGSIPRTDDDTYLRGSQTDRSRRARCVSLRSIQVSMPGERCIFMWQCGSVGGGDCLDERQRRLGRANVLSRSHVTFAVLNVRRPIAVALCVYALNNAEDSYLRQ